VIFVTHDQEEALSLADEVAVMIGGRLVQVDTPRKLYRRPVSRQVAAFVGEANFLPGQAINGQVTCELGQFSANGIHAGPVEVMLRPEEVQLVPSETGSAEIIDRTYFGHDQLLQIRLGSGRLLQSRLLGSAGDFYPGRRVELEIDGGVVVYPASERFPLNQTS
jgi:iron(III) transport system ATP-binding protein